MSTYWLLNIVHDVNTHTFIAHLPSVAKNELVHEEMPSCNHTRKNSSCATLSDVRTSIHIEQTYTNKLADTKTAIQVIDASRLQHQIVILRNSQLID